MWTTTRQPTCNMFKDRLISPFDRCTTAFIPSSVIFTLKTTDNHVSMLQYN